MHKEKEAGRKSHMMGVEGDNKERLKDRGSMGMWSSNTQVPVANRRHLNIFKDYPLSHTIKGFRGEYTASPPLSVYSCKVD